MSHWTWIFKENKLKKCIRIDVTRGKWLLERKDNLCIICRSYDFKAALAVLVGMEAVKQTARDIHLGNLFINWKNEFTSSKDHVSLSPVISLV